VIMQILMLQYVQGEMVEICQLKDRSCCHFLHIL
jgi:hypothetical protein